jgi:hypothetical protein
MPGREYNGRTAQIVFPNSKFLNEWKEQARIAGISLSSWIFEKVEASQDGLPEAHALNAQAVERLREEDRALRREKESISKELARAQTELFKLRNSPFLSPDGKYTLERGLIEALKRGGVWTDRELLKELNIDDKDIEAIKLIILQLQHIQDYGLIEETPRGWRWVD